MIIAKFCNTIIKILVLKRFIDWFKGGTALDKKADWRQYELQEQIRTGFDWEDYDPEHYGWEKSRIISLQSYYNLELTREIGLTTVPHRSR